MIEDVIMKKYIQFFFISYMTFSINCICIASNIKTDDQIKVEIHAQLLNDREVKNKLFYLGAKGFIMQGARFVPTLFDHTLNIPNFESRDAGICASTTLLSSGITKYFTEPSRAITRLYVSIFRAYTTRVMLKKDYSALSFALHTAILFGTEYLFDYTENNCKKQSDEFERNLQEKVEKKFKKHKEMLEKRENISIFYIEDDQQTTEEVNHKIELFKKIFSDDIENYLIPNKIYNSECNICLCEEIKFNSDPPSTVILPCRNHAMCIECHQTYQHHLENEAQPEKLDYPATCFFGGCN